MIIAKGWKFKFVSSKNILNMLRTMDFFSCLNSLSYSSACNQRVVWAASVIQAFDISNRKKNGRYERVDRPSLSPAIAQLYCPVRQHFSSLVLSLDRYHCVHPYLHHNVQKQSLGRRIQRYHLDWKLGLVWVECRLLIKQTKKKQKEEWNFVSNRRRASKKKYWNLIDHSLTTWIKPYLYPTWARLREVLSYHPVWWIGPKTQMVSREKRTFLGHLCSIPNLCTDWHSDQRIIDSTFWVPPNVWPTRNQFLVSQSTPWPTWRRSIQAHQDVYSIARWTLDTRVTQVILKRRQSMLVMKFQMWVDQLYHP